jgi:anti-anti-sigma factor
MTINKMLNEDTVTLALEGRIDTATSPALQAAILEAFQSARNLVLDFEKVPYISSAGLRALLIGQKTAASKRGKMELIHVSEMVYSILETVGFTDILTLR